MTNTARKSHHHRRNRAAIVADAAKRRALAGASEAEIDEALRGVAALLLGIYAPDLLSDYPFSDLVLDREDAFAGEGDFAIATLASFLDKRMCVPRDMGAPAAASIKSLANNLDSIE